MGFIKEEVIPVNSMKVTNHSSLIHNRRVSAGLIAIDVHIVIAHGGLCALCCCGLSQRMLILSILVVNASLIIN